MRNLKHYPIQQFPDIDRIRDEAAKQFGKDLADVLLKSLRNIYDDLNALQNTDVVDSLPTADVAYRGRFFTVKGTGGTGDSLYLCCDTGGGGYGFKEVTFT